MWYAGVCFGIFLLFRFFIWSHVGSVTFNRSLRAEGIPDLVANKTCASIFMAIVWPLLLGLLILNRVRYG